MALSASVVAGCGDSGRDGEAATACRDMSCVEAVEGPSVAMDFSLRDGFYSAPFPSEARRTSSGAVDVSGFQNPYSSGTIDAVRDLIERDARGFGVSSGVFFSVEKELPEGGLQSYAQSVAPAATVFLVDVDETSPTYLERHPIDVEFRLDGGPFGSEHMLSLLPLQGRPLRENTLYAAVVERAVGELEGAALGVSANMAALAIGVQPPAMGSAAFEDHMLALDALEAADVARGDIAGLAVFRTGEPSKDLGVVLEDALSGPLPQPQQSWQRTDVFDDFCVYQSVVSFPVYQAGEPPFEEEGGAWLFDENRQPLKQGSEDARIVVSVPRRPAPDAGFPVMVFSRTGGGGDRPLVDRGVRDETGQPVEAGSGPARELAQLGIAGVSVDGPHGGIRNVTGGDEQFLMFNVGNIGALRDNVRQSALELVLAGRMLETLTVDASDCDGVGEVVSFDPAERMLMGHSMGATITPLTLAAEPSFKALVLSGAGGSWIENVMFKESPIRVLPFAEILLGIAGFWPLHRHDPALSMFQWAAEAADPPIYGSRVLTEPPAGATPRHILMLQGIVDTYILPPIANATSLSFGLDLAGPPLDAEHPELAQFGSVEPLLEFSGRKQVQLPVSGNFEAADGSAYTAVVVQHPEGPIEDGHEVVFQTQAPKNQYRCFLQSLVSEGVPTVPTGDTTCP